MDQYFLHVTHSILTSYKPIYLLDKFKYLIQKPDLPKKNFFRIKISLTNSWYHNTVVEQLKYSSITVSMYVLTRSD